MKTPTLDQQFLSHLSPDQKAQVWNYYLLITNPDLDSDQQVEQISQIWSRAEQDDRLLEWLEFIDYFYTDVDETDLPTAAQRSYLSEYLPEKVGLSAQADGFYGVVFLECPQGQGYVVVSRDAQAATDADSFAQQRCSHCGFTYGDHAVHRPFPEA